MRRRFSSASHGQRPARQWIPLQGNIFSAVTATAVTSLYGLEAPTVTIGSSLSSDPPEDVTLLRIVGTMNLALSGAVGRWTIGLIVQDRTWTPSALFVTDADKRFLWYRTYSIPAGLAGVTSVTFDEPNWMQVLATQNLLVEVDRAAVSFDISPKVKLEDGKALHMVAYEEQNGSSLTLNMQTMRLLMQRSRRR